MQLPHERERRYRERDSLVDPSLSPVMWQLHIVMEGWPCRHSYAPRSKLTADPGPPKCSSSCSQNIRSAFAAASVLKVIQTKPAGAALWYESLHTYCQSHRSSQTGSFQNGCCNTPPLFGCFTALPQLRSAHLPLGGERDGLSFGPCHPWTHSLFNSPLEKVEGPLS